MLTRNFVSCKAVRLGVKSHSSTRGKMNLKHGSLLLLTSTILLVGCSAPPQAVEAESSSSSPSSSAEAVSSVAPTSSSTPSGPARNIRGNLVKKVGEIAAAGGHTLETATLKFTITSIEPITCDAPYTEPPKGTALAVAIEVETTAGFKGAVSVNGTPELTSFSAYHWKGYTPDGTRMNQLDTVASKNCLADKGRLLPDSLGKGEKAKGLVILEVNTPTGTIAYDGAGMVTSGWEWQFPDN